MNRIIRILAPVVLFLAALTCCTFSVFSSNARSIVEYSDYAPSSGTYAMYTGNFGINTSQDTIQTDNNYLVCRRWYSGDNSSHSTTFATGSSVDASGIHLNNSSVNIDNNVNLFGQSQKVTGGSKVYFSVEMYIDSITLNGTTDSNNSLFSFGKTNVNTPLFNIYIENRDSTTKLVVTVSKNSTDLSNHIVLSENVISSLTNALLSVVIDGPNKNIKVYINGNAIFNNTGDQYVTVARSTNWVKIGSGCTLNLRSVRIYDSVLSKDKILRNVSFDKFLKNYTDKKKTTHSYGITGLNKILEVYKNGDTTSNVNLINKYVKDVTSSYKETFSTASGGDVYSQSNELLEDWIVPTALDFTDAEKKYLNESMIDNQGYTNHTSAEVNNDNARATFVNVGTSQKNVLSNSYTSTKQIQGEVNHKLASSYTEYANTTDNTAIYVENSYYLQSKYKCGSGEVKRDSDGNVDLDACTKLMVTADICTKTLNDTDFCGMVIDYSDHYYDKFTSSATTMYATNIAKDKNTNNKKVKQTYGTPRTSEVTDDIIGYTAALFPTGVGFTLYRKDNTVRNAGYDENDGYRMRIFVGGTDNTTATFADVKFKDIFGTTGYETDQDEDISYLQDTKFHNFTIYRTYEKWPYSNKRVYDDGTNELYINQGDLVYMVKFYVDKKVVAIVAMLVTETYNSENVDRCLKNRGAIFLMNSSGQPVLDYYDQNLNHYTESTTKIEGVCRTFGDWAEKNNYGYEGFCYASSVSTGDANATTESTAYQNAKNIGTPSGNILIAVHKMNQNLDGDEYDKIQWSGGTAAQHSLQNENDFCKIYFDNIGYMDYHNYELTQKSFMGQVKINESMTFNIDTTMMYTLATEPIIMFNRLDYNSTDDMEHITNPYDVTKNPDEYYDWLASHGFAETQSVTAYNSDDKRDQHYKSVDGVYYKDLYDLITYKFTDFNGESMFTKKIRVYDYFNALYKTVSESEASILTANDNKYKNNCLAFIKNIVAMCQSMQDYSGYINHSDPIPNLTYNGSEISPSKLNLINKPANYGTGVTEDSYTYGKLFKISNETGHVFTNKINSASLGIKNYLSLRYKVTIKTGADITKLLYIYSRKTYTENAYIVSYETNVDEINSYTNHKITKVVETTVNDNGTTTYVIEVPVPIDNWAKHYTVKLYDVDSNGNKLENSYTYIMYGVLDYCASKFGDNNSTNLTKLQVLVRRIIRVSFDYSQLGNSFTTAFPYKNYLE